MPHYMLQFSYTPQSFAALLQNPEDRTGAVEALAKQAGGRVISLHYHTGEYDGTIISEFPDDASANAVVMAAIASGTLRSTKSTRLYSAKEFVEALGKAGKIKYQPPGKK